MKELERSLKALANKRRLAIVKYLKKAGPAPVADISHSIDLSFKSTSKHLAILSAADIVEKKQSSLQMFYRLSLIQKPGVKHIIALL